MATADQIPSDLTLEIGDNLSPERFMTAARAFFGYIQELSTSFAPEGEPARWVVRVREGSALLGVDPTPNVPIEVVNAVYKRAERGVRQIANGDIDDSGLTEAAIKHLRTLAEISEGNRGHMVPMRLWVHKKPVDLDPKIADVIREDFRADYNDYGTIEGRLETITENNSGALQFQIRDPMWKQRVRCFFPEDLLTDVFDKFRKRVEVSGVIHYRKNGTPISIEAAKVDSLPDDSELPTAGDVRGILRS